MRRAPSGRYFVLPCEPLRNIFRCCTWRIVQDSWNDSGHHWQTSRRRFANLGTSFFRNVGERSSSNDQFTMVRLDNLAQGGSYFNLLAVHPANRSYTVVSELLGR